MGEPYQVAQIDARAFVGRLGVQARGFEERSNGVRDSFAPRGLVAIAPIVPTNIAEKRPREELHQGVQVSPLIVGQAQRSDLGAVVHGQSVLHTTARNTGGRDQSGQPGPSVRSPGSWMRCIGSPWPGIWSGLSAMFLGTLGAGSDCFGMVPPLTSGSGPR